MKQLWLNLETTGLNERECAIVEIAAVVTRLENGKLIEEMGLECAVQPEPNNWTEFCVALHTMNGLKRDIAVRGVKRTFALAQLETLVTDAAREADGVTLAGRSVHFDRAFLRHYAPQVEKRLSHRHLDTSAVEMFLLYAGLTLPARALDKTKHRAMADVRYAMAEFELYASHLAQLNGGGS